MQFPERIFSASSYAKNMVANYKRVVNTLSNSQTPPTVAQAPISLVFKKRIEFYVGVHVIIISYAILWTTAVCKNL